MNESDISPKTSAPALDDARISGAINKILEHPEIIGAIGSMLTSQKPAVQTEETPIKESAETEPTVPESTETGAAGGSDMIATLLPMLSRLQGLSHNSPPRDDNRECLLRALKPYLSRERCEAIDQMLKISRISDILKNMS